MSYPTEQIENADVHPQGSPPDPSYESPANSGPDSHFDQPNVAPDHENLIHAATEPFIELLSQQREEFLETINALIEALKAAEERLDRSPEPLVQILSDRLGRGVDQMRSFAGHIQTGNENNARELIREYGEENPEALFITSVLAGILAGRLGRFSVDAGDAELEGEGKANNANHDQSQPRKNQNIH